MVNHKSFYFPCSALLLGFVPVAGHTLINNQKNIMKANETEIRIKRLERENKQLDIDIAKAKREERHLKEINDDMQRQIDEFIRKKP
jgi:predicted RNase H-like nuclease (RuvC/YqgF family)